ncbi:hypothetical protein B0H21DRAFT_890578 [Amylocystis lapponica]|nr:hypothetical protein B0H21DRAFT_890578 [Amylocystis lapponica]
MSASVRDPNTAQWHLIVMQSKKRNSELRSWGSPTTPLTRFDFTTTKLERKPYSETPNNVAPGIFLFIVPRYANLKAPITSFFPDITLRPSSHASIHNCFSCRILRLLFPSCSEPPPVCLANCYGGMASHDTTPAPSTPLFLRLEDEESSDSGHESSEIELPTVLEILDNHTRATSTVSNIDTTRPSAFVAHTMLSAPTHLAPMHSTPRPPRHGYHGTSSPVVHNVPQVIGSRRMRTESSTASMNTELNPARRRRVEAKPSPTQNLPLQPTQPDADSMHALVPCQTLIDIMAATSPDRAHPRKAGLHPRVPSDVTTWTPVTSLSVSQWQDNIVLLGTQTLDPLDLDMHLEARTPEDGAHALLTTLLWIHGGRPAGTKFKELIRDQCGDRAHVTGDISIHALVGQHCHFKIGRGIGDGPRKDVLRATVRLLMADQSFWMEREGYMVPRLHGSYDSIPGRVCMLRAIGTTILLHYIAVGVGPYPISPFLLLAIMDGPSSFMFDSPFLSALIDVGQLQALVSWDALGPSAALPQDWMSPVLQLLINCQIDLATIGRSRTQAEHNGITRSLVTYITLGHLSVLEHPEFRAIMDGFDVKMRDGYFLHPARFGFTGSAKGLLLSSYNRSVKSPSDLVSHIKVVSNVGQPDPMGENTTYEVDFHSHLVRYLSGSGHPDRPDSKALTLQSNTQTSSDDALLRSRMFLYAFTSSELMPCGQSWSIKIKVVHNWDDLDDLEPRTSQGGSDVYDRSALLAPPCETLPRPIQISSCVSEGTVTVDSALRLLLVEPCTPDEKVVTDMDVYFHSQFCGLDLSGSYGKL